MTTTLKKQNGGTRKGDLIRAIRSMFGFRQRSRKSSGSNKKSSESKKSPVIEKITRDDVDQIVTKILPKDHDIEISPVIRDHFVQIMNKKTAKEIREKDKETGKELVGYEFSDKISDKEMLIRILTDIIEFSINHAIGFYANEKKLKKKKKGAKKTQKQEVELEKHEVTKNMIDDVLKNPANEYIKVLVDF
jgi:hypothetical protein